MKVINFEILGEFWRRHPALFTGVVCLLLTALWYTKLILLYFLLVLVLYPLFGFRLSFAACCLTWTVLLFVPGNDLKIETNTLEGTFYPNSVTEQRTPFGPKWEYQGTFSPEGYSPFPIKVSLPKRSFPEHPNSDFKYHIKGTIKETIRGPIFIPVKHSSWIPIEPISFGLSEWRYRAKQLLRSEIKSRFTSEKASRFLEGISTGDFQDKIMSLEFGRFGLQHIMAVSGFHFSVITSILCWIFFGFLGRRLGAFFLLTSLLLYFLFLGGTPSITRAWIASSFVLIGVLIGEQMKSLNALGIGLLVVLALDPKAIGQIGFQFSFAITASILLYTGPFEAWLDRWFPSRNLHEAIGLSRSEKIGYMILQWCKKATALSLAVNVCALPMTLFLFGKFPLWSLFFNLFFPFMVAIALFLLIFGLCIGNVLKVVGFNLISLNNAFTEFMLNLAYNFPRKWDVYIRVDYFPLEFILFYLFCLFSVGIAVRHPTSHISD